MKKKTEFVKTEKSLSVAICAGMKYDLYPLLSELVKTDVDEILVIGTKAFFFIVYKPVIDKRIKLIYTEHALSVKRNKAIEETKCDIVAFIDDDAKLSNDWVAAIRNAFCDDAVGIATGPSIIPSNSSLWKRTAQIAMGFSPNSNKRYAKAEAGYCNPHDVIGASMAVRVSAVNKAGGWSNQLQSYGEDRYISSKICDLGYKAFYDPKMFVWHTPKRNLFLQLKQIFLWGSASVKLSRLGVKHPKKDAAYLLFIPCFVLFAFFYFLGVIFEKASSLLRKEVR